MAVIRPDLHRRYRPRRRSRSAPLLRPVAAQRRLDRIAHDLRTPLTTMRAGLGLLDLRVRDRLDEDEIHILESVRESTEHLCDMVERLLAPNLLFTTDKNTVETRGTVNKYDYEGADR